MQDQHFPSVPPELALLFIFFKEEKDSHSPRQLFRRKLPILLCFAESQSHDLVLR